MVLSNLELSKQELINDLLEKEKSGILEKENVDLLIKLIKNADNLSEANSIAMLGTTYKQTGFHFDKRLEKWGDTIKYFKKNAELSFISNKENRTHKLIIGDNYDALLNLLITHRNKIDVIYIDPPYGKDDMGEFAKTNYNNSITRDNLLSMLYPRLILAKQLLAENGVIFCSIDDKNQAYVKCLFDEIFSDKNTDILIWNTEAEGNSGNMKQIKRFRSIHEYIIIGYKNKQNTIFNKINEPLKNIKFQTTNLAKNKKNKKGDKERIFKIVNPKNGLEWEDEWKYSKEKIEELQKNSLLFFGKNEAKKPREILPIDESRKVYLSSILNYASSTIGRKDLENIFEETIFDNPKPLLLLMILLKVIENQNAIVLDFFAGSGTTAQAVMQLNREDNGNRCFILCTNNEKTNLTPNGVAYDVTSKRLKRIMTGSCYDGTNKFKWIEENQPYYENLEVFEIEKIHNNDKNIFDMIDETLYGEKFERKNDKIEWICSNFDKTQKYIEGEN